MSLMQFIKRHWLVMAGIIIVGVYGIAPQFLFERQLGGEYRGIYITDASDELYYNVRIRELYDGHFGLGHPYIWENKDAPLLQPAGGEYIIFGLGKLLGLDNVTLSLWCNKVVFPVLLYVSLYLFFYTLTRRRSLAFLFGLTVMLSSSLAYHPQGLWQLFSGGDFSDFNRPYLRPITPGVSSLFFFLYLVFIYKTLQATKTLAGSAKNFPSQKLYWLIPMFILGATFYIYPYTWSFILSFNFVLIVALAGRLLLLRLKAQDTLASATEQDKPAEEAGKAQAGAVNNEENWPKKGIRFLIYVSLGALILSVPYWLNMIRVFDSPDIGFAFAVYGVTQTNQLIISHVVLAGLLLFVVAALLKRNLFQSLRAYIVLALVLAGLIVLNQQLLTGQELYSGHYHWYYNVPALIIVGYFLLATLFEKLNKFSRRFICLIIFTLVMTHAVMVSKNMMERHFPEFLEKQKYGEVIDWVNGNVEPDSVIISTDLELNSLLPMYTSANVFITAPAAYYLVSPKRLQFNYFTYLRLMNVQPEVESFLAYYQNPKHKRELFFLGGIEVNQHIDNPEAAITPELLESTLIDYKKFQGLDFAEQMRRYRADYLIIPAAQKESLDFGYIELVKQSDNFVYYRFDL